MEFKIGDRVIAKEDIGIFSRIKKGMKGTVIDTDWHLISVEFDEYINGHDCNGKGKDGYCWDCDPDKIEKIVKETKLEDITLQKGDRVIFYDGEIYYEVKGNGYFAENHKRVTKIERPTNYETIYEASKDILDKEEKEYLSAVIKPFRDKDMFIKKTCIDDINKEFITIQVYKGKLHEDILLPYFKRGTMYKGMETYKKYTLKELGL